MSTDATHCATCTSKLLPDGPSFYFCSAKCQAKWDREQAGVPEPSPRAYGIPPTMHS